MILQMILQGQKIEILHLILKICLYAITVYIAFWLHDLFQSLFAKIFNKDQKTCLNPIRQIKSFPNLISGAMFIIFGVCWKTRIEGNYKKGQSFLISISGVFSNFVVAFASFLCCQQLLTLSGESFYALLINPLVLFTNALFITNLTVSIFSLFILPPFDGGYIINSILPDGLSKIFMKIKPYSLYILLILCAFLARSGITNTIMTFFSSIIQSLYGLIFF